MVGYGGAMAEAHRALWPEYRFSPERKEKKNLPILSMRRSAISYNRGFPNPMHDSDCDGASTRPATRYAPHSKLTFSFIFSLKNEQKNQRKIRENEERSKNHLTKFFCFFFEYFFLYSISVKKGNTKVFCSYSLLRKNRIIDKNENKKIQFVSVLCCALFVCAQVRSYGG